MKGGREIEHQFYFIEKDANYINSIPDKAYVRVGSGNSFSGGRWERDFEIIT